MKDEELMLAYQNGSESAFKTLYERHSSRVFGYLSSRLKSRALTEEAFQATFMKLHTSRGKYDSRLPFGPWLFTICRTSMIDVVRAHKRIFDNEVLADPAMVGNEISISASNSQVSPFGVTAAMELESLPQNQRLAVELRYQEGLSFNEIAKRLGVTPSNSRQLISRALRKLRRLTQGGAS